LWFSTKKPSICYQNIIKIVYGRQTFVQERNTKLFSINTTQSPSAAAAVAKHAECKHWPK
jgi:hypothetical protein